MRYRFFISSALTLTLAMSVLPTVASTQNAAKTTNATNTAKAEPSAADELEERAGKLLDQPIRYAEAARLYQQAATLRAPGDARSIESLTKAAHLFHYANRLLDARKAMELAATRALADGDLVRASQATVEAALFAHKQGKQLHAQRLGRTAQKLAASPLISDEQRATILGRLRSNPAVASLID
jgi:hypothetical protein